MKNGTSGQQPLDRRLERWRSQGKVGDWVVDRIERARAGEPIGLEEYASIRANTFERFVLLPWLSDEAFLVAFNYARRNCNVPRLPALTYGESLAGEYGHEMEKRLARAVGLKHADLPTLEAAVQAVEEGWVAR
jgi:hypothetical protein